MAVDVNIFQDMPLFTDMDAGSLDRIARLMHYMKVQEGELLAQKGEGAHTFFITLTGNYMISFNEDRAFTLHEKGNIIGWSTVVTPFKYTGTAVALTDGEVLYMSRENFQELLQSDARISEALMKRINGIVSERLFYVKGPQIGAAQ